MKPVAHRAWGIAATIVVAAAVAYGFWIVGSPDSRRMERLDERRLDPLKAIAYEMRELVYDPQDKVMRRALFEDLDALKAGARRRKLTLHDPESGAAYGFTVLDAHRYQLSATFDGPRDLNWDVFWNHPGGEHTWTIDVRDTL